MYHKSHPDVKIMAKREERYGIAGVGSKLVLSTMLGKEEISVSIIDRLLVEQIGQRGKVELLRTYSKDQYHREGTKFLVLRLLPRGHILKGSKTRLCPTKKIWKLDYLSAAIVRRMGNNRLGV